MSSARTARAPDADARGHAPGGPASADYEREAHRGWGEWGRARKSPKGRLGPLAPPAATQTDVERQDSARRGRTPSHGAIRITRCEPETTVAWEGDRASGTVELAAAGLRTSVTLAARGRAWPAGRQPPARADEILGDVLDGLGSASPRSPSRD